MSTLDKMEVVYKNTLPLHCAPSITTGTEEPMYQQPHCSTAVLWLPHFCAHFYWVFTEFLRSFSHQIKRVQTPDRRTVYVWRTYRLNHWRWMHAVNRCEAILCYITYKPSVWHSDATVSDVFTVYAKIAARLAVQLQLQRLIYPRWVWLNWISPIHQRQLLYCQW